MRLQSSVELETPLLDAAVMTSSDESLVIKPFYTCYLAHWMSTCQTPAHHHHQSSSHNSGQHSELKRTTTLAIYSNIIAIPSGAVMLCTQPNCSTWYCNDVAVDSQSCCSLELGELRKHTIALATTRLLRLGQFSLAITPLAENLNTSKH